MEIKNVSMVILDISGYTKFIKMHTMSLLHAEQIVTDLLETIIDTTEDVLTLNKLEGDAAFLYEEMDIDDTITAQAIARKVSASFQSFKIKQQTLITSGDGGCPCIACCTIDQLKLKAILHHGKVAVKQIRQFVELAGEDVIIAHRLLKNTIKEKEYILMTEKFYKLSGGVLGSSSEARTEECEGIGKVKVMAYYPQTAAIEMPDSRRLTRFSGLVESTRLWTKILWRRLVKPKRVFTNIIRD